ncbi:MAG: hypothetical protein IIA45_05880 [Bacteroidetes bacterium]|nr:hypothetical protein [Bacteroidota bacterium]
MDQIKTNSEITFRWDPYALFKGEEVDDLWKSIVGTDGSSTLYILGKGFDVRMNLGLKSILDCVEAKSLDIFLISYDEGETSHSNKYSSLVDKNIKELNSLISGPVLKQKAMNIWEGTGKTKKRVGDRQAIDLIKEYSEIQEYENIIIDISALPRGIYFSLIGKMLSLIDNKPAVANIPNLLVVTAENAELDSSINETGIDDDLHYPIGFGGGIELEASKTPVIWLPLLGENKGIHLNKANQHIRPNEICPILPFPSKNARRADDIFNELYDFFDTFQIESQNIMYVPEQNPFEVYKTIISAIHKYKISLATMGGCKAVVTTLSSKLLSLGALLAAYELKDSDYSLGILNVDSHGYDLLNEDGLDNMKDKSELLVTWLTGEPYIEN